MNTNDAHLIADIFGEPISTYSRAQAIEDGVLVDITRYAQRAGFRFPVAVTAGLYAHIDIDDGVNERATTRLVRMGNMLTRCREAIARADHADRVEFSALGCECWIHIGPGDTPAPVLTIMLEGED